MALAVCPRAPWWTVAVNYRSREFLYVVFDDGRRLRYRRDTLERAPGGCERLTPDVDQRIAFEPAP